MKELIKFALKRRFFNKATLFFNIIFLVITLVVFNLDKIMVFIQPDINEALSVYTTDHQLQSYLRKNDKFKISYQSGDITIKTRDNNYEIHHKYPLNMYQTNLLLETLNNYYASLDRSEQDIAYLEYYDNFLNLSIEFIGDQKTKKANNNILAFMIVTTIYFMMISFSAMAANEVVYEKSTKLLETILTTLPVSAHFFGKMLSGWLNIIIQSAISGGIVATVFLWRYLLDKGEKLCACLQKLDLLDNSINRLSDLTKIISIDSRFIGDLFLIMIILMLGIVSVQVIMVSISSFVSNVEEAGNIQSPMYIIFMGLYYFSLSMNNVANLEKGLGKMCSFLPITSMLFMPYRIMLTTVKIKEIFLAILINIIFLCSCLIIGRLLYGKGILYNKAAKTDKSLSSLVGILRKVNLRFKG